jgi:hypothetical protein
VWEIGPYPEHRPLRLFIFSGKLLTLFRRPPIIAAPQIFSAVADAAAQLSLRHGGGEAFQANFPAAAVAAARLIMSFQREL